MSVLIRVAVNAVALWIAAAIVPGIHLFDADATAGSKLLSVLVIAAIFGVLNAVVKPLAVILSLPALVLTLGLFTLVINGAMLMLTSWLAGKLDLPFHVDRFFWSAVLGAVVISLISWILNIFLDDDRYERRYVTRA